jgi:hypothetical protein
MLFQENKSTLSDKVITSGNGHPPSRCSRFFTAWLNEKRRSKSNPFADDEGLDYVSAGLSYDGYRYADGSMEYILIEKKGYSSAAEEIN